MTIVDTTVWINFFAGTENLESLWLRRELPMKPIGLTDLILCEILQGLRDEKAFVAIQQELSEYPLWNSGGEEMAVASARNYRLLRARGIAIRRTIDCVIATFCITHDYALLHRDRDFDPFEQYLGLRVIHPTVY